MSSALDILKLNRSSAATEEAVFAHWQDYRRWLRLRIELLDVRRDETAGTVAFDDSDELDSQARSKLIDDSLRSIASASRAVFERAFELRLTDARNEADLSRQQRLNLDLESDLERQTLTRMLDECEGNDNDEGLGLVPVDPDAETGWYAVELSALDALPSDATYEIHEKQGWGAYRMQMFAFGLLVVAAILFNLWPYLFSSADAVVSEVVANGATYNDLPLPAYFPADVTLATRNGETYHLTVETRESGRFPPDLGRDAPADVLYWEDAGRRYPARLCVPDKGPLADLIAITVHDGAYLPARTYRLVASADQPADLSIHSCDGGTPHSAVLDSVEPLVVHAPGESVAISGQTALTVIGVTVISADRDPELPPETLRVDVQVVVEGDNPDWTTLRPRLVLSSGVEYDMIGTPRDLGDGSLAVSYGVATPPYARDALWMVNPDPQHTTRWKLRISPPPPRATVLAQDLAVGAPALIVQDTSVVLTVPITNTGSLPLAVQPSDVQVSYADLGPEAAPLPLIDGLAAPLAAGEERTIGVTIPRSGDRPITVALGPAIFDLTPAVEGR